MSDEERKKRDEFAWRYYQTLAEWREIAIELARIEASKIKEEA